MKPILEQSPQQVEWQSRCNLAASILNHRAPSGHTAKLATLALSGATVTDLLEIDAFPHMLAGLPDDEVA